MKTLMKLILPLVLMSTTVSMITGYDLGDVAMSIGGVTAVVAGLQAMGVQLLGPNTLAAATGGFDDDMIADFKTMFGSYYRPGSQNANRLKQLIWKDDSTWKDQFSYIPLEGDVLEYGIMSHTRVFQPFKPYWSETGNLAGSPRRLVLQRGKVNIGSIPDLLVNMWLGFLTTEGGKDPNVDRTTWPFVRWYIEKWLLPQENQDIFMNEAWTGVWADPGTNSTAGPAGTALNGLRFKLRTAIDDGDITPISTGALETDPELFVEQLEDFVENITAEYRGMEMTLNMHDSFLTRFKDGMAEKYNVNYLGVPKDQLATMYKRTNITIKGHVNMLQSVGGAVSEIIWCSPKDNMIRAGRIGSETGSLLKVESVDYKLKLFKDRHIAYDFWDPRIVFVNDVEPLP